MPRQESSLNSNSPKSYCRNQWDSHMLQSFPPTAKDPCSKAAARDRCRCTESYSILIAMLLYAYRYQICIQQCLLYAYLSIVDHFGLGYAFSSICKGCACSKSMADVIMLKSMTEKLGGENPTVGISGFEYENPSKLTLLSL